VYTAQNKTDVSTKNDVWVDQNAIGQYTIHQFKNFVGATLSVTVEWGGKTNCAPFLSTVYLQIYKVSTGAWETIDSDNTSSADTDFILTSGVGGLADYKDGSGVIACRVYQLAI